MNNQKLDEISQAQTQENSKQLEEVDVHEKKKKTTKKPHMQRNDYLPMGYVIFMWVLYT